MIKKGDLSFEEKDGRFVCKELLGLESTFNAKFAGSTGLTHDIETHIDIFRESAKLRTEEQLSDEDRKSKGKEIFNSLLIPVKDGTSTMNLFQQLLFWLSDHWWYYNQQMRKELHVNFKSGDYMQSVEKLIKKYILDLLPQQIRDGVKDMKPINSAVGYGHFALLFIDNDAHTRRIITDSQLFELHDVYGYTYLDITPDGQPIARSVTSRRGERAFFDGIHLMSHNQFRTCAPKTVVIDGGYKVNSTKVTIINGMLFDLIDSDDKVAHTTGATFFGLDFTNKDALQSYCLAENSGAEMYVENGKVYFRGKEIAPIGKFMPSAVKLLDSGFSLYEWSDFIEVDKFLFASVAVVDDNKDFISALRQHFNGSFALSSKCTKKKNVAINFILEKNPEALLLDMHLTPTEQFDGLWIANQLAAKNFGGQIFLVSGYPKEHLRAMRTLIKVPVHIPGKNIAEIHRCMIGKCACNRQ